MSKKVRSFIIVSHCLLNPATRVHILGRRFEVAEEITSFCLKRKTAIIQLPCPEFTAMGYWRNPQGRQQYDNVFFRKHCRQTLESYVDMIKELKNNGNTPIGFIGIQGSPNCCIYWGQHKTNKYKTESMEFVESNEEVHSNKITTSYGVMTEVFDKMLREENIFMPYLEAPVKEPIDSPKVKNFFQGLEELYKF